MYSVGERHKRIQNLIEPIRQFQRISSGAAAQLQYHEYQENKVTDDIQEEVYTVFQCEECNRSQACDDYGLAHVFRFKVVEQGQAENHNQRLENAHPP